MAKIKKRKSKSIGPVSDKSIVLEREMKEKRFSIEGNEPATAIHDAAEIVKKNEIDVQLKSIPEIPVDKKLSSTVSNVISYIDLTDQAVPNIKSNDNIECIDITDSINNSDDDDCKLLIPIKSKALASNDVKIVGNAPRIQDNPIEPIILDDSDEESTLDQNSIKKPVNNFRSVKERLGICSKSKTIKRSYHSPLRNNKKMFKGNRGYKDMPKQGFLPLNLGTFIVDNQRISQHSRYFKQFNNAANIPPAFLPPTDTTENNRLRPIIIDGLNIGHAHGCGVFSPRGIQLCVQFFANRGHKDIVAFIPQHRQGTPGTEQYAILNDLSKRGHICLTPSRMVQNLRMTCYDDRILLNYAHGCNGVVVSNDNYRDLYNESDAIKEIIENRQVMVTFFRDQIIVPEDQYNRKWNVRSLSDILCFGT